MSETAVILGERDFDQLRQDLRDQITKEVNGIKGMIVERPMSVKEIAAWLGVSKRTIDRKIARGIFLPHIDDDGTPWFFPSEVVEQLKRKKK